MELLEYNLESDTRHLTLNLGEGGWGRVRERLASQFSIEVLPMPVGS